MATHGSATARPKSLLLKPMTITQQIDPAEFDHDEIDPDKVMIESLTDIICSAGEEAAAALLVFAATIENSIEPKALANAAKHYAFKHCGELNLYGMVDAQVKFVEGKLFPYLKT